MGISSEFISFDTSYFREWNLSEIKSPKYHGATQYGVNNEHFVYHSTQSNKPTVRFLRLLCYPGVPYPPFSTYIASLAFRAQTCREAGNLATTKQCSEPRYNPKNYFTQSNDISLHVIALLEYRYRF
jgi:hypothetical protein